MGGVATRYAKAIYEYAVEQKAEDKVYAEMQALLPCFADISGFRAALDNPVVRRADKLDLLLQAVGSNPSKAYTRSMELILEQKRVAEMQPIALMYVELYRKARRLVAGKLTTAIPLSPEVQQKVEQTLRASLAQAIGAELELSMQVNPDIVGGFVFDYDTYRLDASMAKQLSNLKVQLLERNKKTT